MGFVHIYCGDGKGKTTAAVGLSVRAAGSGRKVLFVQFMKSGSSSEISVLESIPQISCMYSTKNYGFFYRMTDEQKSDLSQEYRELFAAAAARSKEFDLLVMDELVSAYTCGLLDRKDVLTLLRAKDFHGDIVLTGRDPAQELLDTADYISRIEKVRHPYDAGIAARKGIEF